MNYRGGNPRKKDLGVELDAGVEGRIPLEYGLKAQIGAQAGVLFPGGALEDASGVRIEHAMARHGPRRSLLLKNLGDRAAIGCASEDLPPPLRLFTPAGGEPWSPCSERSDEDRSPPSPATP